MSCKIKTKDDNNLKHVCIYGTVKNVSITTYNNFITINARVVMLHTSLSTMTRQTFISNMSGQLTSNKIPAIFDLTGQCSDDKVSDGMPEEPLTTQARKHKLVLQF